MPKQTIAIDGNNFSSLEAFYEEVEHKLTKNLGWQTGRNLDAFNDILRGGFGVHDYYEPVTIVWTNSTKSQKDLGWEETINYLTQKVQHCHPSNTEHIKAELELAKQYRGATLFDRLIDIIKEQEHIELVLA